MPNMMSGLGSAYFEMPYYFAELLKKLSASAVKYYGFLSQQMNESEQSGLEFTDEEICDQINQSRGSVRRARQALKRHGLIDVRKGSRDGIVHVMLYKSRKILLREAEELVRGLRDDEPDDCTELYGLADDAVIAIHKLA